LFLKINHDLLVSGTDQFGYAFGLIKPDSRFLQNPIGYLGSFRSEKRQNRIPRNAKRVKVVQLSPGSVVAFSL
jgi:hypothetical protein